MDVGGFVEETNRALTPDELFGHLTRAMQDLGFTRNLFAGGSTEPMFKQRYGITTSAPIILNSYPDHWTSHYLSNDYLSIDPVFARVRWRWEPVIWDDLPARKLAFNEKRLMNEARESGLRNGLSLPLHGPDGDNFILSLASDYEGKMGVSHHFPYVRLMAAQFFIAFTDLWRAKNPAPPQLTKRERECLQWTAHGKTAWEIGMILHISEATVRFHLSNAFTKLGAQNRINAVVRAVRWGIIGL